jgi:hypothetical protein
MKNHGLPGFNGVTFRLQRRTIKIKLLSKRERALRQIDGAFHYGRADFDVRSVRDWFFRGGPLTAITHAGRNLLSGHRL